MKPGLTDDEIDEARANPLMIHMCGADDIMATIAARDAEIATLRAALDSERSTRATVEQSLAVQTARGMEIASERDRLADQVAAMGERR